MSANITEGSFFGIPTRAVERLQPTPVLDLVAGGALLGADEGLFRVGFRAPVLRRNHEEHRNPEDDRCPPEVGMGDSSLILSAVPSFSEGRGRNFTISASSFPSSLRETPRGRRRPFPTGR